MKPSLRAVRSAFFLPFVSLLLNGCGSLGDSVRLRKTVLVKVPIDKPLPGCSSQGWEFRHVLEAPKTQGRQGQWYVAWNDGKPIMSSRATTYWRMIFSRAPEIAQAARSGFGAYPLLIEPNLSFRNVPPKNPAMPAKIAEGERVPSAYGDGVRLVIGSPHLKVWPDGRQPDPKHPGKFVIDPMWHFDDAHSEFSKALQSI